MIVTTINMINIGNLTSIEPSGTGTTMANANALLGSYDHSAMEIASVDEYDNNDDSVLTVDEYGTGDYIGHTLNGGSPTTAPIDGIVLYNATVTEMDSTVHNIQLIVYQTTGGDTFTGDWSGNPLDNLEIETISLDSVSTVTIQMNKDFMSVDGTTVCFAAGTEIDTPGGPVAVEDLAGGYRVLTRDQGVQKIM